ncbi:MAG: M23 family metallopeptidase [Spirochaetaceae bacterium]|nr:MAG: M23 family metallopeptidase [Spirochaetaceae bacterium]
MRRALCLLPLFLFLILPAGLYPDTLQLPPDSVAAMLLGGRPLCLVAEGSRYQLQDGELQPLEGLFSFYTTDQQPLRTRLEVSTSVARGEVLQGYFLFTESIGRVDVTLRHSGGDLRIPAKGFPLDDTARSWGFLLGIPSTAEAGAYSLEVRGSQGRRFILYRSEVDVRYRSFRSEEIAFNQDLSELMTTPDPRKTEEYRELLDILASFHARSVFQIGALSIPVEATRRTSRFADRRLYSYTDGGSSRSLHNGIDLAAPTGTAVFAAGAGRVVLAKERIITGNSVVIEHLPGVYSLYYHLQGFEVQPGQRLFQGQRIGTVGMTGLATGPHLHWELRVGGVAVDPDFFVENPMIDKSVFSHNIMDQN